MGIDLTLLLKTHKPEPHERHSIGNVKDRLFLPIDGGHVNIASAAQKGHQITKRNATIYSFDWPLEAFPKIMSLKSSILLQKCLSKCSPDVFEDDLNVVSKIFIHSGEMV